MSADASILVWIQNNVRSAWLSPATIFITHLGDAGLFWILLTLGLLCFRKTRRLGAICALSMLLGMVVTNLLLKNWVRRVRPYEVVASLERIVSAQKDWSFPSGHTTNSFACAWVLFRSAPKRWGMPALVLAALIGLSRLYVGVHYPTDVLVGLIIGVACAEAALRLMKRAEHTP